MESHQKKMKDRHGVSGANCRYAQERNPMRQKVLLFVAGMFLAKFTCCTAECASPANPASWSLPSSDQNLVLAAPVKSWDEALPLGNGLMGGLLWGEGNTVRLSLDRGDLWDERPAEGLQWDMFTYANQKKWVAAQDNASIDKHLDIAYRDAHPTKIPAGRVEIALAPEQTLSRFELSLATAEGIVECADGRKLRAFFSATEPVALLRIPGPEPREVNLLTPMDVFRRSKGGKDNSHSGPTMDKLGYPEARRGGEGRARWYVQEAAEGLKYCVCVDSRRIGGETLMAVAVASTQDDADPLALARRRCFTALKQDYEAALEPHVAWWKAFWAQSAVSLPTSEADILRQYYLVRYFYGAASRRGAPPMPLQGVWTADAGKLPPWKGDYHNDLNTQMTYIAYQTAGHFDEGLSYLDFLWERKPVFEKFAKEFYGTPGLACPGVMTLAGQPLAGSVQYSLSPTMSAWSAHLFYLHWRYSMDDAFLRDRAYPWCSGVGECMLALLQPDADGVLKLPLSSSPEIFGRTQRAWLEPNSNYDLMCLKMLFLSLEEMAGACGKADEAQKWAKTAAALGDYHADGGDVLLLDAKAPLPESHRHLSNVIGLYPFNLITCEGGAKDGRRIRASLAQWDKLGTRRWCGYSFSWMSCLRARVGDAESALRYLDVFVKAFILRNGFHVNGDQTRSGFSAFTYRPFTLEGNFLAMQAVQEMLLQSWSPTPGDRDTEVIRIFPAAPRRWREAAFRDLRAEGGHRVSARRESGATTWFRVVAGKDGVVRIRDNFGGQTPQWSLSGVKKVGDNFTLTLKRGQAVEAVLAKP
jgi:alpha-L-fucosidase 2